MKKLIISSAMYLLFSCIANVCLANEKNVNPTGMFYNSYSGGFSGSEWFQTHYSPATNQYHMADIFGGGFLGTITPDGKIVLEKNLGKGAFSNADNYIVKPTLGGTLFTFVCNRAPFTTKDFILKLDKPHVANPMLSGQWQASIESVNPQTGEISGQKTQVITIIAQGTTLRITDTKGQFMQGVFAEKNVVAFRKIVPEPTNVGFTSFAGSDVNFNQNVLGQIEFVGDKEFSGIFLMQSRTPLGDQTQNMMRYRAVRIK